MLPPEPEAGATPERDRAWRWQLLDAAGGEAAVDEEWRAARFPAQADAESWLGEVFGDLADAGVDQVTLYDGDRLVYGPMSLHP